MDPMLTLITTVEEKRKMLFNVVSSLAYNHHKLERNCTFFFAKFTFLDYLCNLKFKIITLLI